MAAEFFRADAGRLRQLVKKLDGIVERRNTIPIIGAVLIECSKGKLRLTVTNLDIYLTVTDHEVAQMRAFKLCVMFDTLKAFAESAEGSVTFGTDTIRNGSNHDIDVVTMRDEGGMHVRLNNFLLPNEFPSRPIIPSAAKMMKWEASQDQTQAMFGRLMHCVSTIETRYYLNGVHLCKKPDGSTIRAVSTDGHRMGIIDTDLPHSADGISCIVRREAVKKILSLCKGGNEPMSFECSELSGRMTMEDGDVDLYFKMIDGAFPDYTRVIPKGIPTRRATLSQAGVKKMISMMSVMRRGDRSLPVFFDYDTKKMTARASDGGQVEMPVDCHIEPDAEKPETTHGYNFRFIAEQAKVTPTFEISSDLANNPGIVRGEDPNAMWIIMPMRVG